MAGAFPVRVGPNHKESKGEAEVALGHEWGASRFDENIRHALA
jgi:hypothetical protein